MEEEFPLRVLEKPVGRIMLSWDELRLSADATLRWRESGLWKLTLLGEEGRFSLGTLVPEGGRFLLRRTLSLAELRRAGTWPVRGAALSLVWPYDKTQPMPLTGAFCFARAEGESLRWEFDGKGRPKMPV